jgi:hypothetical protein
MVHLFDLAAHVSNLCLAGLYLTLQLFDLVVQLLAVGE